MHIKEIVIRNFRILLDSRIELDKQPCLLIGRNNAGKTSFMVLIEKFLKNQRFDYNDFPVKLRSKLLDISPDTDVTELAIQLMLTIHYEENDNLRNLSEFIVDLDPRCMEVYLLFECSIDKDGLLSAYAKAEGVSKASFIRKHLEEHLKTQIYTFDDPTVMYNDRKRMVAKKLSDVRNLIDLEIIHTKRSVASSEESKGSRVLSTLTTSYFNAQNSSDSAKFDEINSLILKADQQLDKKYGTFFSDFLKTARDFLDIGTLKVRSNLRTKAILEDSSVVVYGDEDTQLPEHQNGLGHMNILYLLLSIEIKKRSFSENKKDIRLLFIEEPEAHTHPQLQYNFARKIKNLVGVKQGIQTIITTHSPHIVASHPFENLRYLAVEKDQEGFDNIRIKHFHSELESKYSKKAEFKFLKQYLTIVSAELFFADKAIFIEGTSEALLLPYFISRFDEAQQKKYAAVKGVEKKAYTPLAAQNIAIIEAGANAKVFHHFVEFLGIPTLVITDIDTVKKEIKNRKTSYPECKVMDSVACNTSNATIKYYLSAPDSKKAKIGSPEYQSWFLAMRDHTQPCVSGKIHVAYQGEEKGFHARSFEDAFFNVNLAKVYKYRNSIDGLKKLKVLEDYVKTGPQAGVVEDIYDLTEEILDEKSGLASTLLYLSYANGVEWETPQYIKEGLEWLQEQMH